MISHPKHRGEQALDSAMPAMMWKTTVADGTECSAAHLKADLKIFIGLGYLKSTVGVHLQI